MTPTRSDGRTSAPVAPAWQRGEAPRRSFRRGDGRRPRYAQVRMSEAEYVQIAAAAAAAGLSVAGYLMKAGQAAATGAEAPGGAVSALSAEVNALRTALGRAGGSLNWLKMRAAAGEPATAAQLAGTLAFTEVQLRRLDTVVALVNRRIR